MINARHLVAELRPMLRLAGPVVLAELGWMGMGVVDTLMVGPLGPEAIAATGVSNSLQMALGIFGMGLLLGLDTVVSHAYGAGRLDECRRWLRHGVLLAGLVAPLLIALSQLVLAAVLGFGFHPSLQPLIESYYSVLLWSSAPLVFYAAFRRYLQAVDRVTPVMIALVTANLVNAIGNWVLIYGLWGMPALGVQGSAWATLFARVYMATVLLAAVLWTLRRMPAGDPRQGAFAPAEMQLSSRTDAFSLPREARRSFPEWQRLRRLLALGLPAAATITLEVGVFAAATALAGTLDPTSTAAHQIALNIAAVAFMIPLGLASAGAVRVGHALGGGRPDGAAAAGWAALLLGTGFMGAAAVVFITWRQPLIRLFSSDAGVLATGSTLLLVGAFFALFDGVQGVATGVLRGLGDTRTAMVSNLAGHWGLGLPIGYLLCFRGGYGAAGLWIGLSIGLVVVSAVLLAVWSVRIKALLASAPVVEIPAAYAPAPLQHEA